MRPSSNIANSLRNCFITGSCGPGNCRPGDGAVVAPPSATLPGTVPSVVIFADSAADTLYALRVLRNIGVNTGTVIIVNEGNDNIVGNVDEISNIAFPVLHTSDILKYLKVERIHLLPEGAQPDDPTSGPINKIIEYYLGAGPNGDAIAQYHVPYIGPWFFGPDNTSLGRFFSQYTVTFELNAQEKMIVNRLSTLLNIAQTKSPFVRSGAILNRQITLLIEQAGTFGNEDIYVRNLFLEQYESVLHNVTIANNVSEIILERGNPACPSLWNLNPASNTSNPYVQRNISADCVKPSFKLDPFSYLRIAATSGYSNKNLFLPTFYRAVIPIPINNSNNSSGLTINGIDFSDIVPTSDLIYTHNSFSLGGAKNSNGLSWIFDVYTTKEDLSVVNTNGVYAGPNGLLLIVEAYSFHNVRTAYYDTNTNATILRYNSCRTEERFIAEFAEVVALIYMSMVGTTISAASLISNISVCFNSSVSGGSICQDTVHIRDYATRQSPLTYVAILASVLYGLRILPQYA